jgi:hypothetical protein
MIINNANGIKNNRVCFVLIANPIGIETKKNHFFGILDMVKRLNNKKNIISDSAIALRVCRSKRELNENNKVDKNIKNRSQSKISFSISTNKRVENGKKIAALSLEENNNALLGMALRLSLHDLVQSQSELSESCLKIFRKIPIKYFVKGASRSL